MMNPELKTFLDRWAAEWSPLPSTATMADRDAMFEGIAKRMRLPTPEGVETDQQHWIDSGDRKVRVRVFRHRSDAIQPCLVYLHGGGWMQGSPETHWDITARLADWAKMTVISVDYAKAPTYIFPIPNDEVVDVMRWAFTNAEMLRIDPERISIGGDSAGAHLAASATLVLRDTHKVRSQLLIYPPCDFDFTRPSCVENAEGPVIKPNGSTEFAYFRNLAVIATERASPLLAKTHVGLPPAFIAVAQYDPLRDSGIAYAEALEAAGVPVVLDRGPGLIHGYLRAMDCCSDSMAKLKMMAAWLVAQNRE